MSENRQATVPLVEENAASGRVAEIFADIKATKGIDFVPNFWRTIAHDPALLRRTWETLKEIMAPGALDPRTKEMIAVAVSATNGCEYCINAHTAAARRGGMTEEMLGELVAVVAMANETNALVEAYQVEVDAKIYSVARGG